MKHRYFITVNFILYADTDVDAVNNAVEFVQQFEKDNDNQAKLIEVIRNDFGSFKSEIIYKPN